jgi:hypothetical protein
MRLRIFKFVSFRFASLVFAMSLIETPIWAAPLDSPQPQSSPSLLSTSVEGVVSPKDAKIILRDFYGAQSVRVKAQERSNQVELKEYRGAEDARFKDWKAREQEARHHFFAEHQLGSERRIYVQSYVQRRDALLKELAANKSKKARELELKISQLKEDQSKKLQRVKVLLEQGLRPDPSDWP